MGNIQLDRKRALSADNVSCNFKENIHPIPHTDWWC